MTRAEAAQALKEGKKLTHRYFSPGEWVKGDGDKYLFEDGVRCPPVFFWMDRQSEGFNDGWEILNN
jgi:hypothetical protein